jgi:hypothetical protein
MGSREGGSGRGGKTGNESKGNVTTFANYPDAVAKAQEMADATMREVGIETRKEYGKTVYTAKHLPEAAKRYGHEARMETVAPHWTPEMESTYTDYQTASTKYAQALQTDQLRPTPETAKKVEIWKQTAEGIGSEIREKWPWIDTRRGIGQSMGL